MRRASFHCSGEHSSALGTRICSPFPRLGRAPVRLLGRRSPHSGDSPGRTDGSDSSSVLPRHESGKLATVIQSFPSGFFEMLRWYLHKQSVQRINRLLWKRSPPRLISYRRFYKTLKAVFQRHASEATLRNHRQQCGSDSRWLLTVLLKAMGCALGIPQ